MIRWVDRTRQDRPLGPRRMGGGAEDIETTAPWINSAGWLANQFTTSDRMPDCDRMFQRALVLRELLATGRRLPSTGSGSTKPRMPC